MSSIGTQLVIAITVQRAPTSSIRRNLNVLGLAMETRDNPYIRAFINGTDRVPATPSLLLEERLNDYVVELRKQDYPVIVYEKNLNRLLQEEAQWIAAKNIIRTGII
jgi:hypothetical protein